MRLIFQHIERTGGTALCEIARRWCDAHGIPFLGNFPDKHVPPDTEIPESCFIGGHNLSMDFPELQGQWFTLLRDPYDRAISEWEHICGDARHHMHAQARALDWLDFTLNHRADNIMVRRIVGNMHSPLAADDWLRACDALETRIIWSAPPAGKLLEYLFGEYEPTLWREPDTHCLTGAEYRAMARHLWQDVNLWRALLG